MCIYLYMQSHQTFFWKYQPLGTEFLSSIEAIYYLCRELYTVQQKYLENSASGQGQANSSPEQRNEEKQEEEEEADGSSKGTIETPEIQMKEETKEAGPDVGQQQQQDDDDDDGEEEETCHKDNDDHEADNGDGGGSSSASSEVLWVRQRQQHSANENENEESSRDSSSAYDGRFDGLLYYFCLAHQRTALFFEQNSKLLPPVNWTLRREKTPKPQKTQKTQRSSRGEGRNGKKANRSQQQQQQTQEGACCLDSQT